MTSDPLVSVITPAYNEEKYLPDCINSVRNQNYDQIEHIVIDDGSTDNTLKIIKQMEHKHLTWFSKSNEGLPATVNRGLEEASGDIITWLNADDVLFKQSSLATIAQFFEQTGSDFVYGSRAIINADSKIQRVDVPIPWFSSDRLRRYYFSSFIFFRSDVVEVQTLDTDYQHVCDYEFALRAVENGFQFDYVDDILFAQRYHMDTKTSALGDEMRKESRKCKRKHGIQMDSASQGRLLMDRTLGRLVQPWGLVQLSKTDLENSLAFEKYLESNKNLLMRQAATVVPRTVRRRLRRS